MGSAALFSGLETGFGLLGKSVLDDQKRAEDEASEERKLKLKAKLGMDLMAAKFNFMKQNPQYKHFATDLSGNIIGFDQYGSPKVVHEASPEEKSIRIDTARTNQAAKQAQANAAEARAQAEGGTMDATNRLHNAQAAYYESGGPGKNKAPPKDPTKLNPVQWDNEIEKRAKRILGEDNYKQMDPSVPEDVQSLQAAKATAEQQMLGVGLSKLGASSASGGAFGVFGGAPGLSGGGAGGGLMTPPGMMADEPDDTDDEDDTSDDHMLD